MSKHKQYREIEKNLEQKFRANRENEAVLDGGDFKDGKLSVWGYTRLKQQCDYIPFSEEIEIKIPKEHEEGFRDTLESMGAAELSRIKKDRRDAMLKALVLLLGGVLFFALGNIFDLLKTGIIQNIIIIASWVFVWGAVEAWFFDRKDLHEKRLSLLQILSAKIAVK
ncbi:MAG: hypothetical protein FWE84_06320 [Firmicutes bacterium]|nr:hypothetical protein [Bacillota bacterium]